MGTRPIRGLSLCTGIAGIELGLHLALPDYRTVCAVEWDKYAQSILVARQQDGTFESFPIWDDVTTFDGREWRGQVDILSAGFPCQPWSLAGSKKGTSDNRWLWPDIARIVGEVRPRFCFFENVPGLLSGGGLGFVLSDLARLGFDAEWGDLSACAVGAPHARERLFLLAYADSFGWRCSGDSDTDDSGLSPWEATQGKSQWEDVERWLKSTFQAGQWGESSAESNRVADGLSGRLDQLKVLGNAVVPLVAAHAFRTLAGRIV